MNGADSRNVDAAIAGAEAGIGYQFTDAIQADISAMYAWGKTRQIIRRCRKLHL